MSVPVGTRLHRSPGPAWPHGRLSFPPGAVWRFEELRQLHHLPWCAHGASACVGMS